ncbi:MAG TPA: hypothetical protein VMM93_10845 [Vicinamibacterales bacterium]|nr:hypothetical protein [Vicinamibacterales bacterium]
MVRRVLAVVTLLACAVVPLSADLRVVSKLEIRKVESTEAPNPFFAMLGQAMAQQMELMNGAETTTTIGDGVIRTEASKPMGGMPAGTITILRSDGTMIGINTTEKTYFRTRMPDMSAMVAAGIKPIITVTRTGEFSTLLGQRVERVVLDMRMPLPIPAEARAQMPPEFPTEVAMTIENWTAEAYKAYGTQMIKGNPAMAALGLGEVADIGFAMRQIVRTQMMAGYEMETSVTSVSEISAPAGFFDVPEGFTEVPPPAGVGGGRGGRGR